MSYATLADLARIATAGWDELAQRGVRDARVSGQLLRTLAEGGDTSAWPAEVVTEGEHALVVLEESLDRASRHADTYIAPRFGTPVPPELVATSDLSSVVAAIALRRLYGTTVPKEVLDGTKWADDYLRDVAAGRVSLGNADAPGTDPDVQYSFSPRGITDDSLKGFE